MRKLIAQVSGKMLMAGYRSSVVTIARAFDLNGHVQNLPDGQVEDLGRRLARRIFRGSSKQQNENALIKVEDIQAEFS